MMRFRFRLLRCCAIASSPCPTRLFDRINYRNRNAHRSIGVGNVRPTRAEAQNTRSSTLGERPRVSYDCRILSFRRTPLADLTNSPSKHPTQRRCAVVKSCEEAARACLPSIWSIQRIEASPTDPHKPAARAMPLSSGDVGRYRTPFPLVSLSLSGSDDGCCVAREEEGQSNFLEPTMDTPACVYYMWYAW